MLKRRSFSITVRGLTLLAASGILFGCASVKPVPVDCPIVTLTRDQVAPITGTGWKPTAERVLEYYRLPSQTP